MQSHVVQSGATFEVHSSLLEQTALTRKLQLGVVAELFMSMVASDLGVGIW